ncbi:hypothetical protein [Micromonospora costi]|uniref:hypothetical protein n=1 Tax=Micromonospora costi TaxID=1530042 RepID=UPI001651E786|nr:hypothetical protein [Micromonospora costi]
MQRFCSRRWHESRGDDFDGWGHSVWYFAVDDGGWPVRQVQAYDNGPVRRYGPDHEQDQYGGLGLASLNDPDDDWNDYVVDRNEFERVWHSADNKQLVTHERGFGTGRSRHEDGRGSTGRRPRTAPR